MGAPPAQAVTAAAARLEQEAPGYLDRVRRATGRLAARSVGPGGDPRDALDDLQQAAQIDVEVPTLSNQRAGRVVKGLVKRLVGWYMRYVGQQVTVLGQSMTRLGAVLIERTEDLDTRTDALRGDLDRLAARVARLEQGADVNGAQSAR